VKVELYLSSGVGGALGDSAGGREGGEVSVEDELHQEDHHHRLSRNMQKKIMKGGGDLISLFEKN
jgi:hypothetical protein